MCNLKKKILCFSFFTAKEKLKMHTHLGLHLTVEIIPFIIKIAMSVAINSHILDKVAINIDVNQIPVILVGF